MIQAVNSINANNYPKVKKQSFGQDVPVEFLDYKPEEIKKQKKPSKLGAFAGYIATQFAAGAIFSGIFDGGINLFRAIKKNKELLSFKEIGSRAAILGAMFALVGVIFNGIDAVIMNNKHKSQ